MIKGIIAIYRQVREKDVLIIFLLIMCIKVSYSQSLQDSILSKCYIGFSGGVSPEKFGSSTYLLEIGGHILHNWNEDYIAFSYNRLFAFRLNFGDSNNENDESQFHRLELIYGRITCLKENHKVFRHIFVGASIGISYNIVSYYRDDIAYDQKNISRIQKLGILIGISITNPLGGRFYSGMYYVYQIISKETPYINFKCFITMDF